jgi:hypothetical protein
MHGNPKVEENRMTTIQWAKNYEDGLKTANETQKPLFLDFFKGG